MNINHLSVSRVGVWKECEQRYKYQYHLKLENKEPEPIYFTYGTIVHRIAEVYIKCRGKEDLYEIADGVCDGSILLDDEGGVAPPLPSRYKETLPYHLYSIKKLTESIGFDGDTEHHIEYDLDPPHKRLLVGYIDRLIIKNDSAWIFDYKTTQVGPWRKTKHNVKEDLQLRSYALVVRDKFHIKAANIKAGLYYLEGAELVGAQFSDETLDKTKEELRQLFIEIQDRDPDKVWGTPGDYCGKCPWRKICPFKK